MECPICNGYVGYLGRLGLLNHFQCRDCGAAFSRRSGDDADLEESGLEWGEDCPEDKDAQD